VVVAHGGVGAAIAAAGEQVPFYLMPYVGGSDTIRSYVEYRFRAENVAWYGAEYRWIARPYVSLAAFVDAGKASRAWSGLSSAETRSGYGIGIIGHTAKQTLGRFDITLGGTDGWQFWLDFGSFSF
jgi:outer membrane protein assembly factor BamA